MYQILAVMYFKISTPLIPFALLFFFAFSYFALSCSKKEDSPKKTETSDTTTTTPTETVSVTKMKSPESVDYDPKTKTFFISNHGAGRIFKKQGDNLQVFVKGYYAFMGVKVHDAMVYAAEDVKGGDDKIRGFDSTSGAQKFFLSIPNTGQLNDIEIVGNYLYVTDRARGGIYKINLTSKDYSTIDENITTPSGLWYDTANKRLLVCNTIAKSSIYAVDITTDEVSNLVKTNYSHLDGIAVDEKGNIYCTSWSFSWEDSQLIRYDGEAFTVLRENTDGMADISYNATLKQLDIANYYANDITHFKIEEK